MGGSGHVALGQAGGSGKLCDLMDAAAECVHQTGPPMRRKECLEMAPAGTSLVGLGQGQES